MKVHRPGFESFNLFSASQFVKFDHTNIYHFTEPLKGLNLISVKHFSVRFSINIQLVLINLEVQGKKVKSNSAKLKSNLWIWTLIQNSSNRVYLTKYPHQLWEDKEKFQASKIPCMYCPNSTKPLISSNFLSIFINGTNIFPLGKALKPQSHYLILIQLTTLLGSYLIL